MMSKTTDHIRPFPEHIPGHVKYVAMCDPHRGTCRKEKCTFAHGRTEQKAWNSILRGIIIIRTYMSLFMSWRGVSSRFLVFLLYASLLLAL